MTTRETKAEVAAHRDALIEELAAITVRHDAVARELDAVWDTVTRHTATH